MQPHHPPRWGQTLLRKFASPDTLEEVEGDLQELFKIWVNTYGVQKAKWKYIITVMTLLRPFKQPRHSKTYPASISTTFIMIVSYFKMSWRTLIKNRVSSLINISGLTIGITTSILIMLVVMNELQYDKFHTNLSSLYILMQNQKTNDGIATGTSTAGPMAEALKSDFPEVQFASRLAGFDEQQVVANGKISYESGIYADPDLFKMMTFPAADGNPAASLAGNSSVVITKDMARKLFVNENPIGKTIVFNRHHTLTVGAVVENIPESSTIKFGIVVPFALFEKENEWLKKWDDNRIRTWIQLHPSANISGFNNRVTQLLQHRSNDKTVSLFAYPFKDLYLRGSFSNGLPDGGRITAVQMLSAFGVFMLLIACINFMNIATAQSEHRAKEVGVRKVLGASRKWIVFQFLNESFVITFLSLFAAVGLTYLIIPSFNILTHSAVHLDFTNPAIWMLLPCIGIITALVAGSYPSLFLSRFVPSKVLKGQIASNKGGGLRRALVTFQFALSIFFLISTIIMYSQFNYVRNRPLGYDQENLININLDSALSAKFVYLKTEMLKIPNVSAATGGNNNILYSNGSVTGMDWPGKRPGEELSIVIADIDYDWTKTMGIKIVDGRDFDVAFASDASGCLINESAVAKMALKHPVGSVVGGHPVVGVYRNFVYNNPFGQISPMAVYLNPEHLNHLYLRIRNNTEWRQTIASIEKITKGVSPDLPFSFSFTKDEYQRRFNEINNTSLIISIFGGMTIFISCLGLFGLSGFVAEKRSKEMSVRKVFGASTLRILTSLSQDFLKPVIYALLLVIPICVFVARAVLANFTYRVDLSWWMFAAGGSLILLIALTIVFYHGWRTAHENPIARLRNE